MKPQVSVIVPVHDVAGTLERGVRSLLEQSMADVEILLVDDDSKDGSADLCDRRGGEDARIVVLHQENRGVSAARNAGLAVARGTFVCFLDADDWADPDMLRELVSAAESSSADVVIAGCHVDVVDGSGEPVSSRSILPGSGVVGPGRPPHALTHDLVNLLGYAWNKLYRRELIQRAPAAFPTDLSLGEDMVFNAEVLTKASTVTLLDRPFVHYVQRPGDTLGTAFRPDFLALRLRGIDAARAVLEHWSVEPSAVESVVGALRLGALRSLVRTTSERPDATLRQKADHLREARVGIDGVLRPDRLSVGQRLQLWTLRHLPASLILVAFGARRRWQGGAG